MACYGGYIGFFFFWVGVGMLSEILIEELFFRAYFSKYTEALNIFCTVMWGFSLLFYYHKYADLHVVRKFNAEGRELLRQTEAVMKKLEDSEEFQQWLKKEIEAKIKKRSPK